MTTNMHMMTHDQKRLREEEEEEDIVYADAMREMLQRASIDVKLQILRLVCMMARIVMRRCFYV